MLYDSDPTALVWSKRYITFLNFPDITDFSSDILYNSLYKEAFFIMKEEAIDRSAVEDKKKRLLTIFGILLMFLLLALLVYYVNCAKPVKQFKDCYQQGQYEEAYTLYEDVLTHIRSNARKAEEIVREETDFWWMKYSNSSASREEMELALSSAKKYDALSDYCTYMTDQAHALFLSRAEDAYCQQILSESDEKASRQEFEDAILLIDSTLKDYPEHTELKDQKELLYKAYKEYQKETGLIQAQELLENGDLEAALSILVPLLEDFPEDAAILPVFSEYEAAYSQDILSAAQPLYEEGAYADALAILEPAYQLLPKNEAIASLYDQSAGHLPTWLCGFPREDISLRGTRKTESEVRDVHGNTYGHAIVYTEPSALSMQTMNYSEGKENYYLKGAYTRLIGTLSIKEGSRGIHGDQSGTFRIYSGDEILLEISDISESSEPVPFSLDITGTDTLTFSFSSGIGLKYLLGDLCIYKTYTE